MADSGDFTWYARSLGKSCGYAGLDDAELVPSDGSAVAAAKQEQSDEEMGGPQFDVARHF